MHRCDETFLGFLYIYHIFNKNKDELKVLDELEDL